MPTIQFFSEGIRFKLEHPRKTRSWIKSAIESEKQSPGAINYIFCSDEYLLKSNVKYLDHDTLTDIVTFDNSEERRISRRRHLLSASQELKKTRRHSTGHSTMNYTAS